jgi:hypothetical protein
MNILIKDIFGKERPMPQDGYIDIRLHFYSGRIESATMQTGTSPFYAMFKVVEVPPHGRLIDADEFKDYIRSGYEEMKHLFNENLKAATLVTEGFCKDIDEAPTVIEAEE